MIARDDLLEHLGSSYTNRVVERLRRLAFVPRQVLETLAAQALNEQWGRDNYALEKYLAVHVPWSIDQDRFTQSDSGDQFYVSAGHLQTRYGTPLYVVFESNASGERPWRLIHVGSQISAPALPSPPDIPDFPDIPVAAEIVMMHDHILGENGDRVPFLRDTPLVAQMCAVSGAIQWSLNRGLQLGYWYFGRINYLVPLYLQNREDITLAPDLVAPVQVNENCLLVRTVLEPTMPYPNARVAVRRHDQLPAWLLHSWAQASAIRTEAEIDDPEARKEGGAGEELAAPSASH